MNNEQTWAGLSGTMRNPGMSQASPSYIVSFSSQGRLGCCCDSFCCHRWKYLCHTESADKDTDSRGAQEGRVGLLGCRRRLAECPGRWKRKLIMRRLKKKPTSLGLSYGHSVCVLALFLDTCAHRPLCHT